MRAIVKAAVTGAIALPVVIAGAGAASAHAVPEKAVSSHGYGEHYRTGVLDCLLNRLLGDDYYRDNGRDYCDGYGDDGLLGGLLGGHRYDGYAGYGPSSIPMAGTGMYSMTW